MKSKILTKIICAAVCCSTLFATGCGDGAGGKATLDFMYTGTQEILELFSGMIREYNNTQGDVDNVKVMGMPVNSGGIDGKLSNVLPSSNGPDVVIGSDEYFKKHTRNMTDLTGLFSDNVFAGLYKDQESRYHYDIQNTTSNADDALYGLPAVNDPTVLYYNKTALEAAGVVCISVDAKDIAAFNAGTLADYNGKKKADYGLTVDIPAKGYFRSNNPYYCDGSDFSGSLWRYPTGSVLVFNDRISCSWDEIEDLKKGDKIYESFIGRHVKREFTGNRNEIERFDEQLLDLHSFGAWCGGSRLGRICRDKDSGCAQKRRKDQCTRYGKKSDYRRYHYVRDRSRRAVAH